MRDYISVSCDFYDELLNAILRKNLVHLTTEEESYEGNITDVYTKDKEEFCVINDLVIRLDKIATLTVDGVPSLYLSTPSCSLPNSNKI